jgi:predicted transcriptional regulator
VAQLIKTAPELRQLHLYGANSAMPSTTEILNSIQASGNGLTLTELLVMRPGIARRTAQRQIAKLIESKQITANGEGRARRYFVAAAQADSRFLFSGP